MDSLRQNIIEDTKVTEYDLGNPSFTWDGNSYIFIPSITEFKRELDTGGFQIDKLLTATVRMFDFQDGDYTPIFPLGLPSPQQKIIYSIDGLTYRIVSIKRDPTNAYFRMTAHCDTKMF